MVILSILLFGTALTASVWTLVASIRPQLHRYRALFAPASAPLPALVPARVTVRWAAGSSPAARPALRAAA